MYEFLLYDFTARAESSDYMCNHVLFRNGAQGHIHYVAEEEFPVGKYPFHRIQPAAAKYVAEAAFPAQRRRNGLHLTEKPLAFRQFEHILKLVYHKADIHIPGFGQHVRKLQHSIHILFHRLCLADYSITSLFIFLLIEADECIRKEFLNYALVFIGRGGQFGQDCGNEFA